MPELNWSLNRNYINEIDLSENKKQSNTASLQWGLKTPSNKMPVKIGYTTMNVLELWFVASLFALTFWLFYDA